MVVASNDAAAAGAFRRIAGRQIQRKKAVELRQLLIGHEFERSKLLSATLPLVTRMFLLGQHQMSAVSWHKSSAFCHEHYFVALACR
jgi:hypothetical protein